MFACKLFQVGLKCFQLLGHLAETQRQVSKSHQKRRTESDLTKQTKNNPVTRTHLDDLVLCDDSSSFLIFGLERTRINKGETCRWPCS